MRVAPCVGDATWEDHDQSAQVRAAAAPTWLYRGWCGLCSKYYHALHLAAPFCFSQKEKALAHIGIPAAKCRDDNKDHQKLKITKVTKDQEKDQSHKIRWKRGALSRSMIFGGLRGCSPHPTAARGGFFRHKK